jgi:hypothetical protein
LFQGISGRIAVTVYQHSFGVPGEPLRSPDEEPFMKLSSVIIVVSFVSLLVSFWNRNDLPGDID